MKRLLIGLLIALAIVGTTCYFLFGPISDAEHQDLIPDDVNAVAIIDAKEFILETGIKLQPSTPETKQMGVDFLQPIYTFLTKSGYIGLAAVLSDSRDLESNLDGVRNIKGYTWGLLNGFLVCHDDRRLLLFGPNLSWEDQKAQQEMMELMAKQTTASPLFNDLKQKDGALRAKVSMSIASVLTQDSISKIEALINKNLSTYTGEDVNVDIETMELTLVGKAEEKSIALTASMTSTDRQTNELLDKYKKSIHPITHNLDRHIIENPAMWMCMNIDGPAILEFLMRDELTAGQLRNTNQLMDVSGILRSFNGDALFMVDNLDKREMKLGLVAQVSDTKFLTPQLQNLMRLFNIKAGEYAYKNSKNAKTFYLTNDTDMESKMTEGGYKSDEKDGYDVNCTFFLSVQANSLMKLLGDYTRFTDETAAIATFLSNEVDRINFRATQDDVEFKVVLRSSINDYVSKWTE